MPRIENLGARRLRLPLRTPYKLAFGPVEAFDTVLVSLSVAGRTGFGDATVLTGYTEETIAGSWALATKLVAELDNAEVSGAMTALDAHLPDAPFTVTAFKTAIEMAIAHPALTSAADRRVPLLRILNADAPEAIEREIDDAIAAGYRTLKIKVGFDAVRDLDRVAFIQRAARGRLSLTVDANQGFSRDQGCRFAAGLAPDSIQFFEQACHRDDWEAAVAVARASAVPVMLDESIYDLDDVRRAAALGAARFVKLKLMKFGSLSALEEGLAEVRSLGLEPVLGNGVASDIGCWMEACAAVGRITTAGEMNGFLKPRDPIVSNPLAVERGEVVIPAGYVPHLDRRATDAQTVARAPRLSQSLELIGAS